jgi:integrase
MKLENPVRRDLQLVALFTGIRSDGVRNLRWADVDFGAELIQVARAQGDRPYSLPMVKTVRKLLERRKADNARSELRDEDGEPVRVNTLPGIHVSRRTFNSVAAEIGIDLEAREALMNHSGRGVNVKHDVQTERLDHLRASAERIERALWERIKGTRRPHGRRRRDGVALRRRRQAASGQPALLI